MSVPHGRTFYKMSGSGNDFIFFDARHEPPGRLAEALAIDQLCARATGIGADGVVFLQSDPQQPFRIRYFNRDGSVGELCGNASLCTTRLAVELGLATPEKVRFGTDAGVISARLRGGVPEIDTPAVLDLREDAGIACEHSEQRIGFANTGVPHLVVLVDDTDQLDIAVRGRFLRHHGSLAAGANVNFVARRPGGRWKMRTFERGVEAETLACGTGAVATGVLLEKWGLSGAETAIETRSGQILSVTVRHEDGATKPSLRGEGRIVFVGELGEV